MALKVLSGVLVIRGDDREGGSATVSFIDNSVTGDCVMHHRAMIGSNEVFRETPCRIVSMREFVVHESAERPKGLTNAVDPITQREQDTFQIDTSVNEQRLFVQWRTHDSSLASKSEISEISFLVIGET
jgi:hypothetical protein